MNILEPSYKRSPYFPHSITSCIIEDGVVISSPFLLLFLLFVFLDAAIVFACLFFVKIRVSRAINRDEMFLSFNGTCYQDYGFS